jgi:starch synthase
MAKTSRKLVRRILMVTSEAVPFAKSGGLADAVGALAEELDRAGHDVRVLMPRYYGIRRERLYRYPKPYEVRVGERTYATAVYEGRLPDTGVVAYFLDHESLYGRDGIYGEGGRPFPDNLERFSVLSHAAMGLGTLIGWQPDIVHAHDWPTALVPALMRTSRYAGTSQAASVFSIHNLGYQGTFAVAQLPETGLAWTDLPASGLLHHDELNLMKAAIERADRVTTVSPTYAREIQTPAYGFSLDPVLAANSSRLTGIVNGVDYGTWNPERDPYLEVNYTSETVSLKERQKTALRRELGLPGTDVPLIGLVTRLASQKGMEELVTPGFGALPVILSELPVQVAILGSGEESYEYYLRQLERRFPNLAVRIGFGERLAHMIEAGSDFFLMPSRYEPCGLNQLYSLRYGTVPIVTRTGGLADTIRGLDSDDATGVFIEHACPHAIVEAVRQAATLWRKERSRYLLMQRTGMKERFTWQTAVRRYLSVYAKALKTKASAESD